MFQETFRACSDIRILPSQHFSSGSVSADTFGDDTTFDVDQFEDYYDDLFDDEHEIAINDIEDDHEELFSNDIVTMSSVQSQRLRLLKKKLILAKALKGLKKLIMLSNLQDDDDDDTDRGESRLYSRSQDLVYDDYDDYQDVAKTTILPWWTRTNSHGRRKKKKRRKKRFSFWYDLLL